MSARTSAAQMVDGQIQRETATLAREAQDVSEKAARIARDPDLALSCGYVRELFQAVQEMALRAERVNATKATDQLFAADTETAPK